MNHVKAAVFGLILASHIVYPELILADAVTPSAQGIIILRDKDNALCSLAVPGPGQTVMYDLTDDKDCEDDWARTIQLGELPSATVILLTSWWGCLKDDPQTDFWLEIKTIKKNTSSTMIEIEYLDSFLPGQIIEPGLQLLGKFRNQGYPIRDQVSCVQITTSAAPPAQP